MLQIAAKAASRVARDYTEGQVREIILCNGVIQKISVNGH
jgi:hypothetical protein